MYFPEDMKMYEKKKSCDIPRMFVGLGLTVL